MHERAGERGTRLGPGAEFDAIRQMLAGYGDRARGIGDDAGLVDVPAGEHLVVSTDAAVEDVHFRREWMSSFDVGYRAAVAALSDLAAMGARPLGAVVAVGVPESWRPTLRELAEGLAAALALADTYVVGGNVSRASELSITTTVLGSATRPLRRSGGSVGDTLWVTGGFGGPGAALHQLRHGGSLEDAVRERFFRPRPRLAEGRWLAEHGARAAIDVSDGLVADLRHLAAASGLKIEVDLDRVPTIGGVSPLDAAASGEEYELAVLGPASLERTDFEREFGLALTAVGRAVAGDPSVEARFQGKRVAPAEGHDHFSS